MFVDQQQFFTYWGRSLDWSERRLRWKQPALLLLLLLLPLLAWGHLIFWLNFVLQPTHTHTHKHSITSPSRQLLSLLSWTDWLSVLLFSVIQDATTTGWKETRGHSSTLWLPHLSSLCPKTTIQCSASCRKCCLLLFSDVYWSTNLLNSKHCVCVCCCKISNLSQCWVNNTV